MLYRCSSVVAALLVLRGSVVEAQHVRPPVFTMRLGVALHAAGLERSDRNGPSRGGGQQWQPRVGPATAIGATLSVATTGEGFGVRIDGDLVPHVAFRRGADGPALESPASGSSRWVTASVWAAPALLCQSHCLSISAGAGPGWYDYSIIELRGDVVNPLAPKQRVIAGRFGLEARLPILRRLFVLQVADYVGQIKPFYDQADRLSTVHTVVASMGLRLGY